MDAGFTLEHEVTGEASKDVLQEGRQEPFTQNHRNDIASVKVPGIMVRKTFCCPFVFCMFAIMRSCSWFVTSLDRICRLSPQRGNHLSRVGPIPCTTFSMLLNI